MRAPIRYWNRYSGRVENESVYGDFWIRLLYETGPLFWCAHLFLSSSWISRFYGFLQNLPTSKRKIAPFVNKFKIPMEDFEAKDFQNFNDFFIRRFKSGTRPFSEEGISAPAEARYLGFANTSVDLEIPIKGLQLCPKEILGDDPFTERFLAGPTLVARLCPVDYHRFHYPVTGRELTHYSLGNTLHSVNPVALRACPSIFKINERIVNILDTEKFGLLAYVEVGALCVGKIVQTHPSDQPFKRGDEKGYFLFGASTVILFGEKGRWKITPDILQNTQQGIETYIHLGDIVAKSPQKS